MSKKLSKRGKLYLVNGICFLFLAGMYIFRAVMRQDTPIFILLLIMCTFTFFSLIVYYLSIIADAMSKRYHDRTEDENKPKTK